MNTQNTLLNTQKTLFTRTTLFAAAAAVLAVSTAFRVGAEPIASDAGTQAGALLAAHTEFHAVQPAVHAGTPADAQTQARAIVAADRHFSSPRALADNRVAPLPAHTNAQLAHRGVNQNADAQSMAATVLLGRGA